MKFERVELAGVKVIIPACLIAQATGEIPIEPKPEEKEKNQAAVELGRLGGKKGGKARAEKLTPEERSEIARKAAESRWGIKST